MSDFYYTNGELYHYGVPGMKWGVIRSNYKSGKNVNLRKKAYKYDKKAENLTKKSEKYHAKYDLEGSYKQMQKAAKLRKKADMMDYKASKSKNDNDRTYYEQEAAKYRYKASIRQIDGNAIAKTKGYGPKALSYSIKSDRARVKAEKARYKIAKNNSYINKMNQRVSTLTKEELEGAYKFVENLKAS